MVVSHEDREFASEKMLAVDAGDEATVDLLVGLSTWAGGSAKLSRARAVQPPFGPWEPKTPNRLNRKEGDCVSHPSLPRP